jgi:hypothetical protein
MDWVDWHADYDVPGSKLAHRLHLVQEQIRAALDAMPAGPRTAVSLCAGQGRDLIDVLAAHPRGRDVRARLVELDPRNVAAASDAARAAGLDRVEVVAGDAGLARHYAGWAPADLVVACGVFGNLTDDDVRATVDACRWLCAEGGTVVWTLHRGEPDRVPPTQARFARHGFRMLSETPPELGFSVGAHRHERAPAPGPAGERIFTFVGSATLRAMRDP